MKIQTILSVFLAFALTGCATIMNGKYQDVKITSMPDHADVYIDGCYMAQTPFCASLSRDKSHIIQLELEGFAPYQIQLRPKLSGWFFGNLFIGGPVGLIIDVVTGSLYTLNPSQIQAYLRDNPGCACTHGKQTIIATTMTPDPSWKKIGDMQR